MKKALIPSLLAILFLLIITSCGKDKPIAITAKDITGKWKWIYSYIDNPLSSENPLTPNNTGITESIEYSSNKEWKKVLNGITIDSGTYYLEHNNYTNPSNKEFIYDQITYNRKSSYLGADYYQIRGDTLIFDPGLRDYWTSLNVRNVGGTKWFVKQ